MDNLRIKAEVGLSDYDGYDVSLAEFKAWLDKLAASVGADSTTARFFFEMERDYDGYSSIECYVYRYETDEEMTRREDEEERERAAYEARRQADARAREMAEYERLRAKYG